MSQAHDMISGDVEKKGMAGLGAKTHGSTAPLRLFARGIFLSLCWNHSSFSDSFTIEPGFTSR